MLSVEAAVTLSICKFAVDVGARGGNGGVSVSTFPAPRVADAVGFPFFHDAMPP